MSIENVIEQNRETLNSTLEIKLVESEITTLYNMKLNFVEYYLV